MKKIFFYLSLLILLSINSSALTQDMRGVWVSSVFNLDFPSKQGLSENELKQEIESIILTAKSSGLTDIFFQVRPCHCRHCTCTRHSVYRG